MDQTAQKLPPMPNRELLVQALISRDSDYEGVFITAVKTTGIFCRPGCPCKMPKAENVEFYRNTAEALSYGYRACKVCRPMEPAGATPGWLEPVLQEIHRDPATPLKDRDLRQRGLEPARVRRWFQKHHGMTFQAYLRALRVNRAFGLIRHGSGVTEAAFAAGYDSLSGFSDAFRRITGATPSVAPGTPVISITRILTPFGPMFAGAVDEGICLLEFTDRRMVETQFKRLNKLLGAPCVPGDSPHFGPLKAQLDEYFAGERQEFDLPLVIPGSEFQRRVWRALMNIPYGRTRSYQEQAEAIGNVKAVRAVARANGDNRLAFIVPCHRVIGKDGSLTGYGGGLWRKEQLLRLEGALSE
jgi:AraC family transcriptional regulator of adaptative response/methylated-DNA-[protein]-cysteine methyltransferase